MLFYKSVQRISLGLTIRYVLCTILLVALLSAGAFAQLSSTSYKLTGGAVGGGGQSSSAGYEAIGNVPLMAGGSSTSGSYALQGGTISHLAAAALTADYSGALVQIVDVANRTLTVNYEGGSSNPVTGTFYYRQGGQQTYSSAAMTDNGAALTYNLSSVLLTVRGLEYYFAVTQGATSVTVGGAGSPYVFRTSLTNAQGQRPAPMPEAQYRIIGLPLIPQSSTPATVFTDDLGAADATKWRLGRYNNSTGEVSEFPSVSSVAPGVGYWLIARGGLRYGSAGTSIRPDYYDGISGYWFYEVALDSGWNMVANPFPFAVSFAEMYLDSGGVVFAGHPVSLIENAAHYYNGTSYTTVTTIPAWEGVFLFANKSGISALFRYHESGAAFAPKPFADGFEPGEWVVNLKMTDNGLADDGNLVGVRIDADEQVDQYDFSEPPPAPGAPSLSFKIPGGSDRLRTTDFRPPFETGATWDIVFSKGSERMVTVSGIADLDNSWDAVLELDNATVLYLEDNQFITLPEKVSSARLMIGNKQYLTGESVTLPGVFALDQNYPNPFNPMTNIHFVVPTPSHVRLEIHNILGQRVKSLVNSELPKGEYTVPWYGQDDNDNDVASGIYFYRLTADSFSQCRKMVLLK